MLEMILEDLQISRSVLTAIITKHTNLLEIQSQIGNIEIQMTLLYFLIP